MTDNLNSAKQDRDPGTWLPPAAKCAYATRWITVKYRYALSVDPREKAGLAAVLADSCGAKTLILPPRIVGGALASAPVVPVPLPIVPLPIVSLPSATPTAGGSSAPTTAAPTTPAPTTPAPAITVAGAVWPGAFCVAEDHWDYGYTSAGTLMRCTSTDADSRFRWRSA